MSEGGREGDGKGNGRCAATNLIPGYAPAWRKACRISLLVCVKDCHLNVEL